MMAFIMTCEKSGPYSAPYCGGEGQKAEGASVGS